MGAMASRILLNPLLLLLVLAAAIYTGFNHPEFSESLSQIGVYYISLLKMTVLPYLFVTITAGVARIASDPDASNYITRIVVIYPLALILAALVALGCAFLLPPGGHVDAAAMAALGDIVNGHDGSSYVTDAEVTLYSIAAPAEHGNSLAFVDRFIPDNIFSALSSGDSLKTVIFCIVFGAALARSAEHGGRSLMALFAVVQHACVEVIRWLNLIMPFALFAMVSAQVASVGIGPLVSLGSFIQVQALAGAVLLVLSGLIIAHRARVSPVAAFSRLSETILLAITTRSSLACIPIAVREMTEKLHFDRFSTDMVLPLGITLCRLGAVPFYAIGTVFIAQVYGVELDLTAYALIAIASVAAGFASSGATGAMTVLLIGIVAEPLKLPIEAAIVLFIAVDPIVDVVRTVVLVYGNCALSALIMPRPTQAGAGEAAEDAALPAADGARA